jgi:hypothetical protein
MFLGIFGVGGLTITSATAIVLYGMHIADRNVSSIVDVASGSVENLPQLLETLPDSLQKVFNDRRDLDYASNIEVDVKFLQSDDRHGVYPALTIRNNGDETVSLLTVRVAALDKHDVPLEEWTELVATPLGIEHDLRGPILPGTTRYVRLGRGWLPAGSAAAFRGVPEIADVRVLAKG